ncbi:MAG TPA: hypothetical protein VFG42_22475 [Baekduia sp.]|nr:hypothetical protein [Baekduia sp.]HET6509580.1 hypothetical protein [Baekduia sp.]
MVGSVAVLPLTRTSSDGKPDASRWGQTCSESTRRISAQARGEAASSRQIAASSAVRSRGEALEVWSGSRKRRLRGSPTRAAASAGAGAAGVLAQHDEHVAQRLADGDPGQAERAHLDGHAVDPDRIEEHVGGGVVADGDHEQREVAQAQRGRVGGPTGR